MDNQSLTYAQQVLNSVCTIKQRYGPEEGWKKIETAILLNTDLHENNLETLNVIVRIMASAFGFEHPGFQSIETPIPEN